MRILLIITAIYCFVGVQAQNTETDSLKKSLAQTKDGRKRVDVLEALSYAYLSYSPDTALQYALKGLQLAQSLQYRRGEAICTNALGNVYFHQGDNAKALETYLHYLELKEELKDKDNIAVAYFNIAGVYTEEEDYPHALFYLSKARREDEKSKDTSALLYDVYSLGSNYARMNKEDSALYYLKQSYQLAQQTNDRNMLGAILNGLGEAYLSINDTALARRYFVKSMPYAKLVEDKEVLTSNYFGLAKILKLQGRLDSAILYARKAFLLAQSASFAKQVLQTTTFLTELFSINKRFDSAFHYQQLRVAIKDSLFNIEQVRKVQNLKFQEEQRQQSIETSKIQYRNKVNLFIVIFVSAILLTIALFLWRNNRQKRKANLLLQQEKEKVESTLTELKSTQAQLIQSEKMASLGELTAGIAHEIQNPLNFVNNFSEVNKELVDELKEELKAGNTDDAISIADDIKANEEKINHHGKRADAIVKGMLQHSRQTKGEKEPTDINALCDEYLRLSYHGLRAKDKSFNADFKTEFDESIGKINIVPQDMGRVLLNLFNNAFYEVNEKKKLSANSYQPLAEIKTRRTNDKVEITVTDNGNGIPQNIIDKIFQPFFTTKPTGQGTGLGLSLSYDIIKAHGGEIIIKTKEAEYAEFIIKLPIQ